VRQSSEDAGLSRNNVRDLFSDETPERKIVIAGLLLSGVIPVHIFRRAMAVRSPNFLICNS
jgi:hypothetical protein